MAYIPNAYQFIPDDEIEQRERSRQLIKSVLAEREQRDAELVHTALHESSHAVVAMLRGHKLKSLAIDMQIGIGECYTAGYDSPLGNAIVSAAGIAANAIMEGTDYQFPKRTISKSRMRRTVGYSVPDDVSNLQQHLRRAGHKANVAAMRKACDQARALLERPDVWQHVVKLADMLLQSGGFIVAKGCKAPPGTLARRIQRQRAERRRTSKSFRQLMKSANAFWESGVAYP